MAFYFRLPVITDLTIEQQTVLNEPGAIAVSGGPGTGKSVVSLWRHIRNHDMKKRKSLLLTYTKSLESYLAASSTSENAASGASVNRIFWWTHHLASKDYEEIIIDEAQDVTIEKYQLLKQLTPMVSYSADDNQILYRDKSVTEKELRNIFTTNKPFNLHENFRNTAEVVQFVRSIFPTRLISPGKSNGPKPSLVCSDGDSEVQRKIVFDIINTFKSDTHNIAILLPLTKHVDEWFSVLKQNGIKCSKFTNQEDEVGTIENVHVTTFKSAKGLEFDTVILPDFDRFKTNISNLMVVKENDYYVVFTRSRRNLMLIDNSVTNNKKCALDFLSVQIQRTIVEVDYSYLKSTNTGAKTSANNNDLPF